MLFVLSGNMAINDKKLKPGEYEIIQEGDDNVLRVNYIGLNFPPSVEDSKLAMNDVVSKLIEFPGASRIILSSERNYYYSDEEVKILREIANSYTYLIKQKRVLGLDNMGLDVRGINYSKRFANLQYVMNNLFKSDPLGAYVEVKRLIRETSLEIESLDNEYSRRDLKVYLNNLMEIFSNLDKSKIINLVKNKLDGLDIGDRSLYKTIFRPFISPNFMYTRLMEQLPLNAKEVDSYNIDEHTNVSIFEKKEDIKLFYYLNPPEFSLLEDKLRLLDLARTVMVEHEPKKEEFTNTDRMRNTFFNIGRDLLNELNEKQGLGFNYQEINELAEILVRYTVGFGLLEVLLKDTKIQDLVINGPIGETPIFIVHQDYGECVTNIIPSKTDGESWATKFRLISGRPLDEANPVLDTELLVPGARARVAIISNPLNPLGLGYAFRRHREKPWTLPLFMDNKTISPEGAGLLSFLIDGGRTILVAGTRSSGKTSLLGSLMVEIMRKSRIITVEDTLELPVNSLRDLGYNIQPMKVRAALVSGGSEVPADEGIRTSLRLGDSSLIVGEVRSKEALALYEAMRIGALANVVAGTIHGASPYAVFDRVVNDLGVPRTSFKATDIIVVVNPIKTPDGLHKIRRVLSITEVRKGWEEDPLREGGFVDLMRYNSKTDKLEFTDDLVNGDSEVIKEIASSVKEWSGNWDAVWDNIHLRSKIKQEILDISNNYENKNILEADFVIRSNDEFHRISDRILRKYGVLDSKKILFEWRDWLEKEVKLIFNR